MSPTSLELLPLRQRAGFGSTSSAESVAAERPSSRREGVLVPLDIRQHGAASIGRTSVSERRAWVIFERLQGQSATALTPDELLLVASK